MNEQTPTKPPFKALIVGGSVAGLTLAHAFTAAGIDHTLLEARQEIDPEIGQSIIIMPNGARILDQLGVCWKIEEVGEPLREVVLRRSDGRVVSRADWPEVVSRRLGYQHTIIERKAFLRLLYDQLPTSKKSQIHLSKKVTKITQTQTQTSSSSSSSGVQVKCKDGSTYEADIVIGADGIHSRVREEMRRNAEENGDAELVNKDKDSITAEYNCIYGIATPSFGLEAGTFQTTSEIDHNSLVFVGRGGIPLWFFMSRMPRRYAYHEIPRYTRQDIEEQVERFGDFQLIENVGLRDLWRETARSGRYRFVPMEEAMNECWTWGRFVGVGDAVHKMTPNMGQGGNQAIESAAALANALNTLLLPSSSPSPSKPPTLSEIQKALTNFQQSRHKRATFTTKIANRLTREDALATLEYTLRFLYLRPEIEANAIDFHTKFQSAAPFLDFLPLPERARWDPKRKYDNDGKEAKGKVRALL